MGFWNALFATDTERKRDDYKKLEDLLREAIADHDKEIAEAEATYSAYTSSVPNLSNSKIPSDIFDPKREKISAKVGKAIEDEDTNRTELVLAKQKAHEKYLEYKKLAIAEAEEKERQKAAEKKRKEAKNK